MPDWSSITVFVSTHIIFRYHLPLKCPLHYLHAPPPTPQSMQKIFTLHFLALCVLLVNVPIQFSHPNLCTNHLIEPQVLILQRDRPNFPLKPSKHSTFSVSWSVLRFRIQIRIRRIRVFGPPGSESGSISQRYGSGFGSSSGSRSFYQQAKTVRKTLIPTAVWLLFWLFIFEKKIM